MPSKTNEQPSVVAALTGWTHTAISRPDVGVTGHQQLTKRFCEAGIILRGQWGRRFSWNAVASSCGKSLREVKTIKWAFLALWEAPVGLRVQVGGWGQTRVWVPLRHGSW